MVQKLFEIELKYALHYYRLIIIKRCNKDNTCLRLLSIQGLLEWFETKVKGLLSF